jgi:hypothetical protein
MAVPLALPIAIDSTLTSILLFASVALALAYTQALYGSRPLSRSWFLIVLGLLANAIAESGELFVFVQAAFIGVLPGLTEGMLELAAHTLAAIALMAGCYYLYKEAY